MKAQFVRDKDPLKNLMAGLQRRSITNFEGPEQAFYWELRNPYTKKELSKFLETPYEEIYLIADQDDPQFPEMELYLRGLKREIGRAHV